MVDQNLVFMITNFEQLLSLVQLVPSAGSVELSASLLLCYPTIHHRSAQPVHEGARTVAARYLSTCTHTLLLNTPRVIYTL